MNQVATVQEALITNEARLCLQEATRIMEIPFDECLLINDFMNCMKDPDINISDDFTKGFKPSIKSTIRFAVNINPQLKIIPEKFKEAKKAALKIHSEISKGRKKYLANVIDSTSKRLNHV